MVNRKMMSILLLTIIMCNCSALNSNQNSLIDEEETVLSRIEKKDIIVQRASPYKKSLFTQSFVLRKAYYDDKSDMIFSNQDYYFGISCLISIETYKEIKQLRDDFFKDNIELFITSNEKETVGVKERNEYFFRISIVPNTNLEKVFNIYQIKSNDDSLKTIDIYKFYSDLEKKYKISFIGIGTGWLYITVDDNNDFENVVNEIKSFSPMMAGYKMDYLLNRYKKDGVIEILF